MAASLLSEVVAYVVGSDLSISERAVLFAIAEQANAKTRQAWQEHGHGGKRRWVLAEVVGLSQTGLRDLLQRLAKKGMEVRVPIGTDARGRVFYAAHGRQTTYLLPTFPKAQPDGQPSPAPDGQASPGDGHPSAYGDGQPSTGDGQTPRPDGQPSPYPSNIKSNNNSSSAREPRHIVIQQTDARPSEADAVIARIQNEIKPRSLGGFLAHLGREGDLQRWVDEARAAGTKNDLKTANELRQRLAPCGHGEAGGDQLHPTSGEPWCIWCRKEARMNALNNTARPAAGAQIFTLHPRETA